MIPIKTEGLADRIFESILAMNCPDYIVEVGSFDGETLRNFHKASPTSTAVGFEANPYNFFNFCNNKNIQHVAISNKSGATTIFQPLTKDKNSDAAFINAKAKASGLRKLIGQQYIQYDVPVTTLDTFFSLPISMNKRFVLLIDVEGCSYEVLEGAKELLKCTSAIKIEVENKQVFEGQKLFKEVHKFLQEDFESMGIVSPEQTQSDVYYINKNEKALIFTFNKFCVKWQI